MQKVIVTITTTALSGAEETYEVATDNRDRIRWELAASREKWPPAQDAPFLWSTYIAYSALRRTAELPADVSFDAFNASTSAASTRLEDVNPTQPAPIDDSSLSSQ